MNTLLKTFLVYLALTGAALAASGSGNVSKAQHIVTGTAANELVTIPLGSMGVTTAYEVVVGSAAGTGAFSYYPLVKLGGNTAAPWSVASGRIAACTLVEYYVANTNATVMMGYGTAACGATGNAAASPPTGGICYGTTACSAADINGGVKMAGAASTNNAFNGLVYLFDAGATNGANATIYPFWRSDTAQASLTWLLFCTEQPSS